MAEFRVVVRNLRNQPVVIVNFPLLHDGSPMPTLFWLVARQESESVARVESQGGVKVCQSVLNAKQIEDSHLEYARLREKQIPLDLNGLRPSGGVGGTRRGVKCLHAHLAWFLAGGSDPVGSWTAEQINITRDDYLVEIPSDELYFDSPTRRPGQSTP